MCGAWEGPYDWGIDTCAGGDLDAACAVAGCLDPGTPHGEIPHAVLVLKDATASPQEWRVLLVNTGHPDSSEQTWWIWDPATPGDVVPGVPNLAEVVFCSGHTVLSDGRVLFAGGQVWPAAGGPTSCLGTGPSWAWIYNPATNTWAKVLPNMAEGRYYPSCVLDTDGRVLVMTGDGNNPTTFEVYNPGTGSWSGIVNYSTVPKCGAAYPHVHLLPKRNANHRAALLVSSPFYYDNGSGAWPCIPGPPAEFFEIPTQILPLKMALGDYSLPWEQGPMPGTNLHRAENGSVLVVNATGASPTATVYIAAGRDNRFGGLETATAERFLNPQTSPPATGVALPSLNIARWDANFVLLPGRRILALGGETTDALVGDIKTPEMLDLQDLGAGWKKLADHQEKRVYHSWAVLLPDGRVLLGGGRKSWTAADPVYKHAEVLNPPYDKAWPPTRKAQFASTSPTSVMYGSQVNFTLAVEPPEGIWEFELLRPGSMTHTVDFDQRMVLVAHQSLGSGVYRITAPATSDLAPPGWYLLFAVSNDGVPSVGRFVRLH